MEAVRAYFAQSRYRLTEHQLDSYDDFAFSKIPRIIRENNPFVMKKTLNSGEIEVRVFVGGRDGTTLHFSKPTISVDGAEPDAMLPSISRNMGTVYDFELSADILVETEDLKSREVKTAVFERTKIARIPTMLHSSLCFLRGLDEKTLIEFGEDPAEGGGYFIVDGKEKVVVAQETIAPNTPVLRDAGDGRKSVLFRSAPADDSTRPVEFEVFTEKGGAVSAKVRALKRPVPVAVLFRALGFESDLEIVRAVVGDRFAEEEAFPREAVILDGLRASLTETRGAWSREAALALLADLTPYGTLDHAQYIVQKHVLPGAGFSGHLKGLELGRLVRRLVEGARGLAPNTDRESFLIKRVRLSGQMLAEVFGETYAKFKKGFRDRLDQQFYFGPWNQSGRVELIVNASNLGMLADGTVITDTFYRSFKGNWSGKNDPAQGGIVQDLNRVSYIGNLSHVRRVNNPLSRDVKLVAPHRLHGSQWGYMCPVESPDGASVGLLKNLAVTCHVTSDEDPRAAIALLREVGARAVADEPVGAAASAPKVLVNGVWMFVHDDPAEVARRVRAARRAGRIGRHASVAVDLATAEVRVYTDAGRCTRPLFVAPAPSRAARARSSWTEMLEGGAVEYVDVMEADNCLISMDPDARPRRAADTHAELHPSAAFSVFSVTVPLLSHNPATRMTLAAAQSKQAVSVFNLAFRLRSDVMAYVLDAPERPLVTTEYEALVGCDTHPQGNNTIVALMCFSGFNQEDAVVLNATSLERGLFRTTYFKTAVYRESSEPGKRVYFDVPGRLDGSRTPEIDENGLPFPGASVRAGDTLVGMVSDSVETPGPEQAGALFEEQAGRGRRTLKNVSPVADASWEGSVVDNVVVHANTSSEDGRPTRTCRVRYRKTRVPELGDKFASRHAQKGVLGCVIRQEDMPYTADGVVPDLIINPHAMPSRMTTGQLIESVLAKAAVANGARVDATMFGAPDPDAAGADLRRAGLDRSGDEVLYSPATGAPMPAAVFTAPVFYQRLKHMSADKIKARMSGAVSAITRQPTGMRGTDRPLRVGEMETAASLAHGISLALHESMTAKSDASYVWQDASGNAIAFNEATGRFRGIADEHATEFRKLEIPRAFGVLQHELDAIGIGATLGQGDTP